MVHTCVARKEDDVSLLLADALTLMSALRARPDHLSAKAALHNAPGLSVSAQDTDNESVYFSTTPVPAEAVISSPLTIDIHTDLNSPPKRIVLNPEKTILADTITAALTSGHSKPSDFTAKKPSSNSDLKD